VSAPREVWVTAAGVAGPFTGDAALDAARDSLPPKQRRQADRSALLAVLAARAALQQAGLAVPQPEVGVVLGVDYGAYPANLAHQRRLLAEGPKFVSPAEFTLTLPNITTAFVSITCGLRGPTATLADGDTAGGSALGTAFEMIALGEAEALLAGAAEPADGDCDLLLQRYGARRPQRPEHAALWLLESDDHARNGGRAPLARLLAYEASTATPGGAPGTTLWHLTPALLAGGHARRTDLWRGPHCAPQVRSLTWESC
jgi:3-oxoacyl-[acyl-carrier-protein] synthase II